MLSITNNPQFQVIKIMVYFYTVLLQTLTQGSGGSWGMIPNSGSTNYFLVLDATNIPFSSSLPSIIHIHFSSARTNPVAFVLISSSLSFLFKCHLPPSTSAHNGGKPLVHPQLSVLPVRPPKIVAPLAKQ